MSRPEAIALGDVPVDARCGPDLEYDPEFLALQQAAVGKREQQFGATIIPAEPPEWRQVEKLARSLGGRTRDIRIAVYAAQAQAEVHGLAGYADTLEALAQALDDYWDHLHPRLEQDGDSDPMPRVNALAALGDVQGAGRSLRDARVLDGALGRMTLRDAEAMLEGGERAQQMNFPGGRARLTDALRAAHAQGDPAITAVARIAAALDRVQAIVTGHLGTGWAPDFTVVRRTLDATLSALGPAQAHAANDDAEDLSAASPASSDQAGQPTAATRAAPDTWRHAELETRAEAQAMLEKVSRYFERHEPSHPAPMMIRRIQQLIPLDFYEIVKNLAPAGIPEVETLMARRPDTP